MTLSLYRLTEGLTQARRIIRDANGYGKYGFDAHPLTGRGVRCRFCPSAEANAMIATWMERTLILTPEKEEDFVSLNVLAAGCDPRNWTHTPPQAEVGSGTVTEVVAAPPLRS